MTERGLLGLNGLMMVDDGTRCGSNKACFNGDCKSLSYVKQQMVSDKMKSAGTWPSFQPDICGPSAGCARETYQYGSDILCHSPAFTRWQHKSFMPTTAVDFGLRMSIRHNAFAPLQKFIHAFIWLIRNVQSKLVEFLPNW